MKGRIAVKPDEMISVVVPVYNVESYLARCVDSILNQTYKSLEIILIDDGATDKSREICDAYGETYPDKVKAIHQKNTGLSGARNAGLSNAHGKYITFIDSDDWIEPDMIETMYRNLKSKHAQISGIGCYQAYSNGELVKNSTKIKIQTMGTEEALGSFLFNDNLTVCVWGKLYDISLCDTVRCPEGKLFEDHYTTYKLIDRAKTVVFDPQPKYCYFKRKGSIGHSAFSDKTYELYWGIQEEYAYITNKYPDLNPIMSVAKITWELVFINMMFRAEKDDREIVDKTRRFARRHMMDVFCCNEINTVRKIQIGLFAYQPYFYKKAYFRYKKWKGIS